MSSKRLKSIFAASIVLLLTSCGDSSVADVPEDSVEAPASDTSMVSTTTDYVVDEVDDVNQLVQGTVSKLQYLDEIAQSMGLSEGDDISVTGGCPFGLGDDWGMEAGTIFCQWTSDLRQSSQWILTTDISVTLEYLYSFEEESVRPITPAAIGSFSGGVTEVNCGQTFDANESLCIARWTLENLNVLLVHQIQSDLTVQKVLMNFTKELEGILMQLSFWNPSDSIG